VTQEQRTRIEDMLRSGAATLEPLETRPGWHWVRETRTAQCLYACGPRQSKRLRGRTQAGGGGKP
jgi:hypothetical protein